MRAPTAAANPEEASEEREARAAVERICASREFRRSEQCKRFLTYVCGLALSGRTDQISEYSIGIEIFHRPPDYSPAEDGVVRRQAHVLRKKLAAYYADEGRGDRVRIELPVGHYLPAFQVETGESEETLKPAAPVEPVNRGGKWMAPAAIGVLSVIALAFVAGRWTAPSATGASRASTPRQIEEIWGPWLRDTAGVTICLANSRAAVVHHVQDSTLKDSHPQHFRPDSSAERALREFYQFPEGGYLFYRPSTTKTGVAESIAAVNLAQMFGRLGVPVRTTETRLLNWADFRTGNYILLGHNEANPWVDKLLHKLPFRLGDSQGIRRYIENTTPGPGEKPSYFKEAAATSMDPVVEYALVSMLRGLDDRHSMLLVTGLDGQASQMASEFLSQPASLERVVSKLEATAPAHSGPWYFQFILRAEVRDRLATRADIVAVRVL